ncbi:biotin/lipoyl-binding protein [Paenibacillus lycopersici]|uniref:Biotin/lipoyl-binding protein n=1 Tax=Paenibacillus lycopersici TaxID=2704462 RepID=A0A6C0G1Q1_9BACL|nr:biotin/lipoyl-binding protein [Paenibacillus lycopersici]QHT61591.1 biotin/lipoyl-binding protein [Paenibacillus lycopersici]
MEELVIRSRKRKIRLAAGLFVVLLIAFTLAGNTLRSLSLPKVYMAAAAEGQVTHRYEGTAAVEPGETIALANPAGWKAANVLVKQGDRVHDGQTLVEYNDDDAQLQLADLKASLKKLELSMNQLHADYIAAANGGGESAIIGAGNAIETAKLDIATEQQHIANLQKSIAANGRLTAPFDGIVMQVNAAEGSFPQGGADIVLSNTAKGYRIQLAVPADTADLLEIGETMDGVSLDEPGGKPLSGTVSAIDQMAVSGDPVLTESGDPGANAGKTGSRMVTIALKDESIRGGERVIVKLSKSAGVPLVTVPAKAVHQDERGAYVYTLREESGPLGNAYYAAETPVRIIDANAYVMAVDGDLFAEQEVVVDSSGYLTDGVRVRR